MAFSPSSPLPHMPKVVIDVMGETPLHAWLIHEPILQVFTRRPL